MQKKLAKLFFPDFMKRYELLKREFHLSIECNRVMNREIFEYKNLQNYVKRANEIFKSGYYFLGIQKTKHNELVIIYMREYDRMIDIYVDAGFIIGLKLNIFSEISIEGDRLFIDDIQCALINANKGYGSLAMEHLLYIADKRNIKKINGNISSRDIEELKDRERLKHFYEKFGFIVDFDRMYITRDMSVSD